MILKRIAILPLLFLFSHLSAQVVYNSWVVTWMPTTPCTGSPTNFYAVDTSGVYVMPYGYWQIQDQSLTTIYNGSGTFATFVFTNPGIYQGTFSVWDSNLVQNGDTVMFTIFVDSVCGPGDYVSGHVYFDANNNGNEDAGEPGIPGAIVELNPGPFYITTNSLGDYSTFLPAGNWTLSADPPSYWQVSEPVSNSYSLTLTGSSATFSGNDFGIEAINSINDLVVYVGSSPPVPGFDRTFWVNYYNAGTTILSGSVTLIVDPALTFISSSSGGVQAGNSVTWNFTNLMPAMAGYWYGYQYESALFNVPLGTPIGSYLTTTATINPIAGDATPANNVDSLIQAVVASYDPNDKAVFPEGFIEPTQNLEYKVRFQNTGTYYATNVVVRDVLDSDLDISTFQFHGGSHPASWVIDNHVLTVTFDNIMLPDSNMNEPASHGYFRYSISPVAGIAPGTTIENTANIYFDFNAAVITNTVVSTIETVSIDRSENGANATVYPNPFQNETILKVGGFIGNWNVEVVDLSGKVVMTKSNEGASEITISRNGLHSGMYLYRILSNHKALHSGKLIIY